MKKIVIDPITRISGLLNIEVSIEKNKIVDAKVSGSQFRGFEKMFQGREPFDIIRLVPRVCGICSTHHALGSVLAIENAMKVTPDYNGKVLRDIANGFELLQNYLRHLYFFVFPDYVKIESVNPLFKTESDVDADYRLSSNLTCNINGHYVEAIKYSREAHRALAVLAGKVPHCHGIWIGGTSTKVNIQQIEDIKNAIIIIKRFIETKLIKDIETISEAYIDYFSMGKGHGNLMSFGLYDNYEKPIEYSKPQVRINGKKEELDLKNITESVKSTWATSTYDTLTPGVSDIPTPDPSKKDAYSWVNSPRYKGKAVEVGALARMTLSGNYSGGVSTMDRLVSKVYEAKRVCEIIEFLIDKLKIGDAVQKEWQTPTKAEGIGIIEAERGSLGHWISIDNKKVSNYTLITPSAWNLSPMDGNGIRGTVEEALIGTEIKNPQLPVEIGRIVRSFDPCLNCAAHVISDKYEPITIEIFP